MSGYSDYLLGKDNDYSGPSGPDNPLGSYMPEGVSVDKSLYGFLPSSERIESQIGQRRNQFGFDMENERQQGLMSLMEGFGGQGIDLNQGFGAKSRGIMKGLSQSTNKYQSAITSGMLGYTKDVSDMTFNFEDTIMNRLMKLNELYPDDVTLT